LYLTDSLSDLDGVGRYAMRLIAALEELEPAFAPRVLLARRHRPTSSQVPARWPVEVALPPDTFFRMSAPRFWPELWLGTARAARAARGADLVHAIKDYPHNLIALRAARRCGLPCVATAHGTYTVQPLVDARHAARARATYRGFAGMISVSGFTRRRLEELLAPADRPAGGIQVIPNCVDAEHYREPRAARLSAARPWHGRSFTLSIGELKERKGHHLALAAFTRVAPRFPELQHYVVGRHSAPGYVAALRADLERAGVAGRVHFLGNVSEDEKVDLLQRCLVFVHTPVTAADGGFEGFGIVYLEAAACGVPSIGTLESGAEDAIEDGASGVLVAQDAGAIAEALARLLADEELRRRLGAGGRERARRSSWRANAERVRAIYRAALAGGPA
jgi:phosphatidylinositol alpha-1,6-mannosyltransferase